jgi:hypothetical protein
VAGFLPSAIECEQQTDAPAAWAQHAAQRFDHSRAAEPECQPHRLLWVENGQPALAAVGVGWQACSSSDGAATAALAPRQQQQQQQQQLQQLQALQQQRLEHQLHGAEHLMRQLQRRAACASQAEQQLRHKLRQWQRQQALQEWDAAEAFGAVFDEGLLSASLPWQQCRCCSGSDWPATSWRPASAGAAAAVTTSVRHARPASAAGRLSAAVRAGLQECVDEARQQAALAAQVASAAAEARALAAAVGFGGRQLCAGGGSAVGWPGG